MIKEHDTKRAHASRSHLVFEASILILAEECCAHARQTINFEQMQTLFESVVDVNFTGAVDDDDTSRPVAVSVCAAERDKHWMGHLRLLW